METILDVAYTWFFENLVLCCPDTLIVNLAEGIKGRNREFVQVTGDQKMGPYFPVTVNSQSRTVSVTYQNVLAHQVVSESYGAPITEIVADNGALRKCTSLEYLNYLIRDSYIEDLETDLYDVYLLWTEDHTIFVICKDEPQVAISDRSPDLTIERSNYVAS